MIRITDVNRDSYRVDDLRAYLADRGIDYMIHANEVLDDLVELEIPHLIITDGKMTPLMWKICHTLQPEDFRQIIIV